MIAFDFADRKIDMVSKSGGSPRRFRNSFANSVAKATKNKKLPRKKRARLIASGKLSDYRVKRMIRLYASDIRATEASRQTGISYPTVRSIYSMIRRRMLELKIYFPTDWHAEGHKKSERQFWDDTTFYLKLDRAVYLRRGVKDATRAEHEAEILYRQNSRGLYGPNHEEWHFKKILGLIRKTGPLNRPANADQVRDAINWYIQRDMDLLIANIDNEDEISEIAEAVEEEAIQDFSTKIAAIDRRKRTGGKGHRKP